MDEGSTTGVADEPAKRVPGYGPVEAKGAVAYAWQPEGIWGERVVRYDLKALLITPRYDWSGPPTYVAWAIRRGPRPDVVVEVGECPKGHKFSGLWWCGQVYAGLCGEAFGKYAPMYVAVHDAIAGLRKTLDGRHGRAGEKCDDRGNIFPSSRTGVIRA